MIRQGQGGPEVAETVVRVCTRCGGERRHKVTVSLRKEGSCRGVRRENDAFARESYKVLKCLVCGRSVKERGV